MQEFPPSRLDPVNQCLWRRRETAHDERLQLTPKCSVWSRTSGLRIIISSRKPGKMPSYHAIVRGGCDDSAPMFLPVGCLGTPMALLHVACCLAQPRRGDTPEARRARAYPTPTHPFQSTSTVCGPDAQASVCAVCTRGLTSHAPATDAT